MKIKKAMRDIYVYIKMVYVGVKGMRYLIFQAEGGKNDISARFLTKTEYWISR